MQVLELERIRMRWERMRMSGRIPQAMLWVGPEGIGKTALAWWATQSLLCTGDTPPCGHCPACQKVKVLQHPDLYLLPPAPAQVSLEDAAVALRQALLENPYLSLTQYDALVKGSGSLSVESVRRLHSHLALTSAEGSWRVVWFWHAERLTRQAANAFLKLVEEPPAQTFFLFLTTRLEALPATIRSRSVLWRISPLSAETLLAQPGATPLLVSLAEGSLARLQFLLAPTGAQGLDTLRQWLGWCLRPQPQVDPNPLLEALQKSPDLLALLEVAISLVRQHPNLSPLQKTYAIDLLLRTIDELQANLQVTLVLRQLTTQLATEWAKPIPKWSFWLG